MAPVKQGRRNRIVGVVGTLVLVAAGIAGVVAVRGGIVEHRNASALNDPDSDFVPVRGTVTDLPASAQVSGKGSTQMSVRFTTADDRRVETRVWTRRDNDDFDQGQRIDLEYVAQRPSAARLPGDQGGVPEPWTSIVLGVAILAGLALVPVGLLFDAVSGRRRRRRARPSSGDPSSHRAGP
jgi:hypothetical protein